MVLSPIPDELVELIARRFRLLSEPMRIRLLDRLRDGEATVHQLADELGSSQQNVSKHLTLLADAGVLARRKQGHPRLLPARRRRTCSRSASRSVGRWSSTCWILPRWCSDRSRRNPKGAFDE